MLRSIKEIMGYNLNASDGEIGKVNDFLFDDQKWAVRYLVADTGKWLPGRKVLISPSALGEPNWASSLLPVSMTKAKIENSPSLQTDLPVSRQYEMQLSE